MVNEDQWLIISTYIWAWLVATAALNAIVFAALFGLDVVTKGAAAAAALAVMLTIFAPVWIAIAIILLFVVSAPIRLPFLEWRDGS